MDFLTAGQVGAVDFGSAQADTLLKALTLGYGTDSASMTGGRSLVPQDIEGTVVAALRFNENDFKLLNLIKSKKVGSSIHEYTRRNEVGDEASIFVQEGAESSETAQTLERVVRAVKYMQTYRKITLQMRTATTLEDAEASEKMAGVLTILKGIEWGMFHANSAAVPTQFDSVNVQIRAASQKNIYDLRGKDMAAEGDKAMSTIARQVYEAGGWLTHSFMPPQIGQDIQDLIKDRVRFNTEDSRASVVAESYPTPFSDNILVSGKKAGPDKFFRIKSAPTPGDAAVRPDAPTFAMTAATDTTVGTTGFVTATAGTYYYQVFAISDKGISAGAVAASQAVAAGKMVTITITPGVKKGTGYIICRSKLGAASGADCREMYRIADSGAATTVTNDTNDELPGTGEILLISHDNNMPSIQWDQFLPTMRFDLFPTNAAIIPFLVVNFGTPDVKVPWYQGLIKNVGYVGMDWF